MYISPELQSLHNIHMVKARALFDATRIDAAEPSDKKLLFICFTNRSGSNYLSEAIASSGDLNRAGEYFNADTMENQTRRLHLTSFGDYMHFLRRRAGFRGRLCSKIAVTQFAMLNYYGVFDQAECDPRFLFIERRDLLDQAISWQIAAQTLRWRTSDKGVASIESLVLSNKDISARVDSIARQNYLWKLVFATNKIPFFHVIYEDLVAAPLSTLEKIAAWLDINKTFDFGKIELRRQRGRINEEWFSKYSPFT